ncbi:hypothetical protein [Rivularia sp. UHCC 0363]|uniref:hypothetical protein n=1 Tax=Rivularia sp. UHCC 0363 TaxID=3110244 RepID=UPI002B2066AD|nr:hypothetical protein [Rivularia sp. UHCC 0363]MEA5599159.1 hypothetical protein [Rivularia sp. UHCC 0363]
MPKSLHEHLSNLPEEALQEFTQWCVTQQAREAGYEFIPNEAKLEDLPTADYIPELVGQFMDTTRKDIRTGLVATFAGKQADNHSLSGLPAMVDFVSLYVKHLFPAEGTEENEAEELLTKASEQQLEKLSQIAQEHNVKLSA